MRSDETHYPTSFKIVVTEDHFGRVPLYRGCVMMADTMVFYMAAPAGTTRTDKQLFAREVENQFALHLTRAIETTLPAFEDM